MKIHFSAIVSSVLHPYSETTLSLIGVGKRP